MGDEFSPIFRLLRHAAYPGCQRLFMRGFRFQSSLQKWPARKAFSRGFAARVFGLRPNTCRPAADETKLPFVGEKKPLVPRVHAARHGWDSMRSPRAFARPLSAVESALRILPCCICNFIKHWLQPCFSWKLIFHMSFPWRRTLISSNSFKEDSKSSSAFKSSPWDQKACASVLRATCSEYLFPVSSAIRRPSRYNLNAFSKSFEDSYTRPRLIYVFPSKSLFPVSFALLIANW